MGRDLVRAAVDDALATLTGDGGPLAPFTLALGEPDGDPRHDRIDVVRWWGEPADAVDEARGSIGPDPQAWAGVSAYTVA